MLVLSKLPPVHGVLHCQNCCETDDYNRLASAVCLQKQGVKWALAGRNKQKMESIRQNLAKIDPTVKVAFLHMQEVILRATPSKDEPALKLLQSMEL